MTIFLFSFLYTLFVSRSFGLVLGRVERASSKHIDNFFKVK